MLVHTTTTATTGRQVSACCVTDTDRQRTLNTDLRDERPTSEGTGATKELDDSTKAVSFPRAVIVLGRVPLSWLREMSNDDVRFSAPIELGTAPLNWFLAMLQICSLTREPMLVGIVPFS